MAARSTKKHAEDDQFSRVAPILGARSLRIHSAIQLHERLVEGLSRAFAVHLVSGLRGITLDDSIRALNISSRSWARMKADKAELNKPLDVDQSARVWSLAEILAKAEDVFGNRDEAEHWLSRPAIGLDSRRPIQLMATPQGAELVKTLLDQMKYGVYA